jgi:hypothetical protein
MEIGITEKRLVLRAAALLCAAYAFEPTRGLVYDLLKFQIGPVSILSVVGVLTAIFVWGNYKRAW